MEDLLTGGHLLQRSIVLLESPQQPGQASQADPFSLFFGLLPSGDLNFRSAVSDELLLQHILRLSELQRGPMGAPPAPKEAIEALEEVKVTEEHCRGAEYPRCAICCEDLKDKATKLPCGHLFDGGCISQWLGEHNQCPVCRHPIGQTAD